jgi:hypothetical protein
MSQEVVNSALKDISDKLGAQYARKVTFVKCDWHVSANAAKEISQANCLNILVPELC